MTWFLFPSWHYLMLWMGQLGCAANSGITAALAHMCRIIPCVASWLSEKNGKEIIHVVRSRVRGFFFSLRPERFRWSLYVSLETVHIDGTMFLVSVFQVARRYGRFFPIWRRRTNPFLQLHETGHIWRNVLGFALGWRGLETTIVLLTVWQTRVSHGLCFADERDLWRNSERQMKQFFYLLCSNEIYVTVYNKVSHWLKAMFLSKVANLKGYFSQKWKLSHNPIILKCIWLSSFHRTQSELYIKKISRLFQTLQWVWMVTEFLKP